MKKLTTLAALAALAWSFTAALDTIDLEQAETVQNRAAATQLAQLER